MVCDEIAQKMVQVGGFAGAGTTENQLKHEYLSSPELIAVRNKNKRAFNVSACNGKNLYSQPKNAIINE